MIGRKRSWQASSVASQASTPVFALRLGELDDQDRVLARQADQHQEADLRENVDVHLGDHDADDRAQQAHRHDEDDRQRQRPAFVLGRQHQEHQHDRQQEDPHRRVAGLQLQQRQLGPLGAHRSAAIRSSAAVFQMRDRLAGTGIRPGVGVDGGRRDTCCSASPSPARSCSATVAKSASGTISPRSLRTFSCLMSSIVWRILVAGLHVDLPGSAEAVEVVDVVGAEGWTPAWCGRRRSRRRGPWPGRGRCQFEPGRVGAEAGEQPCKCGSWLAVGDDFVGGLLQRGRPLSPVSWMMILKPPAVPRPSTGGAPKMLTMASGTSVCKRSCSAGGDGVAGQFAARAVLERRRASGRARRSWRRWRRAGSTGRRWRRCA